MSTRHREEYVKKSCDAFVQLAFFLAENRIKKLVYFRNLFSSIISIRICDCGAQFLETCFRKTVMVTNNSGFNSTYLLVSEERRKRERRERRGARINRRANEEDSSGKFKQHPRLVF